MQTWRDAKRAEVVATLPPPAPVDRTIPGWLGRLTPGEQADLLAVLRQAIHEQATGGMAIFEGFRARLIRATAVQPVQPVQPEGRQ